jgi:molybdate transport system ATP-binding protein
MSLYVDVQKRLGEFHLQVMFENHGGILGLLGASGCGKSKTLQCITGIEKPDQGRVIVDGRTFFDSEKQINIPVQQRRVGYLFQNYALFPNMTVAENIACGVRNGPDRRERQQCVAAMIERMRLTGLEGQKPSQLSGGQQQRVALGRILVNEPDILLLDEPFSALDSYIKEQVMTELSEILAAFGKDVIIVTHSRDEAYQLCQTIAILDKGELDAIGPTREMFADPGTRAAAILTGCKNVVAAYKAGPGQVYIPDWGVTLHTGCEVRDDLTAIGIRGHDFHGHGTDNVHAITIVEEIEQPFEWIIKFRYTTQAPDTMPIWWRFAKPDRPLTLPDKLGVAPRDILLLYR